MAMVFPDSGLSRLSTYFPVGDDQFLHLYLYSNNVAPTRGSTFATFVKCEGQPDEGFIYTDPDFLFSAGPPPGLDLVYATRDLVHDGFTPGQAAYGYMLVQEPATLIAAEKFANPVNWFAPGQTITLDLVLRLFSLRP